MRLHQTNLIMKTSKNVDIHIHLLLQHKFIIYVHSTDVANVVKKPQILLEGIGLSITNCEVLDNHENSGQTYDIGNQN